jgi:hypothetical protein
MSMRCMSCRVGSRQANQPSHATKLIKPCTWNFSRSDTIGNRGNLLLPREISQCKCDCGSPIKWEKTPRGLRLEIDVPNGTSGSVGLPTSSNADSLTDNGRPVRKLEKLGAASASDDISGARPGYIYLENLGPGTHVVQVTAGEK